MFPFWYDPNEIPNLLDEFDYFNEAIEKLNHISTNFLEDLCFNIIDLFETQLIHNYYSVDIRTIHKDWLNIANSLVRISFYERTQVICFISRLEYFSVEETPVLFLDKIIQFAFIDRSGFLSESMTIKSSNTLGGLNELLSICPSDDYDKFIFKLHQNKETLNISQKELALRMCKSEEKLSCILRLRSILNESSIKLWISNLQDLH